MKTSATTAPANSGAAIEAVGLVRRYGVFRVLRGLDLTVERGRCVAMFGANGAGKTTLLRVIAGLLQPQSGTVSILGTQLPAGSALRRRLGMISHDSFLYSDLTARENLDFYARLYGGDAPDRCEMLIEKVGLARFGKRPVRSYSRGMQQRLALARCVLHRPELILLDEPFTGLDPEGSELLVEMLDDEKQRGATILMTTHDFAAGLRCADEAVILSRGVAAWSSGDQLPGIDEMMAVYARTTSSRGSASMTTDRRNAEIQD